LLPEDHGSNRFTRPSVSSPRRLLEWDRIAFSRLPKVFQPIELSPVCPLGTVSALSPISQDWTVSTVRNTEVVADSTNVLAIECAVRRREQRNFSSCKAASVHLAASHRLLRGQKLGVGPGARQHFRAFTLCSAGRDPGSLRFETDTVDLHIGFYLAALKEFLGTRTPLRVAVSDIGSNAARPVVLSGVVEKLQSAHKKVKSESTRIASKGEDTTASCASRSMQPTPLAKNESLSMAEMSIGPRNSSTMRRSVSSSADVAARDCVSSSSRPRPERALRSPSRYCRALFSFFSNSSSRSKL